MQTLKSLFIVYIYFVLPTNQRDENTWSLVLIKFSRVAKLQSWVFVVTVSVAEVARFIVFTVTLPVNMQRYGRQVSYLLTCTGIGTTILLLWPPPRPPGPIPAFTLFHLALRFWNQIFTWTSDSLRLWAIWDLSDRLRYFLLWNS